MRILFLDDDKERTSKFKQATIGQVVYCVETPEEAKEALDRHSQFDVASLDHDLFGQIFQPSDEKSGFAVCEYIDDMEADARPKKVVCHSYNPDGVDAMVAMLRGSYHLEDVFAAPFGTDEYWQQFRDESSKASSHPHDAASL